MNGIGASAGTIVGNSAGMPGNSAEFPVAEEPGRPLTAVVGRWAALEGLPEMAVVGRAWAALLGPWEVRWEGSRASS